MSEASPTPMTVDDFLIWAEGRPGRHELVDGYVYAMAPERAGHARGKARAHRVLEAAIARASLSCEAFADGMTVRIDAGTAYEPDALVQCGETISDDTVVINDPTVVVEVLSASAGHYDRHHKLAGYFSVPSIHHYLIVDLDHCMVIHHARAGDDIRTRILATGALRLEPPGLDVDVAALLG